jgi:NADH-quinone oxidoreductase subunit L
MILAMGVGSWVGGLFHLITHAFFKALLFLGSGSVIHAAHHEQELPQYGGLIRKIPVTGITFGIAVLAISGFGIAGVGFSGYYSKDMILTHAASLGVLAESQHLSWGYWLLFYLPVIVAYITPFYMTRCWMLTFWGKPRNQHLYDNAHEEGIMWVPLAALAVASIFAGSPAFPIKSFLDKAIKESTALCAKADPNFAGFRTSWPSDPPGHGEAASEVEEARPAVLTESQHVHAEGEEKMHHALAGGFAWLIAIGAGFLMYMNGYGIADGLMKIAPVRWVHTWLYRKMYFDEWYYAVFVDVLMLISRFGAWFDRVFVDGLVNLSAWMVRQLSLGAGATDKYVVDGAVNGVASLSQELGAAVRAPQTGRIRLYVTVLMIAVTLGLAGAIVVVLSR